MSRWRLGAIGALALGLLAAAFLALFERVEVEVKGGPRAEARANSRLAAERFLGAMGGSSQRQAALDLLPDPPVPVLLFAPAGALGEAEAARLVQWMRQGGRLVATPQPALLEALGLAPAAAAEPLAAGERWIAARRGFRVWMPEGGPLPAAAAARPLGHGVALEVPVGQGALMLLASDAFLRNDRLGELDHAAFLWYLVSDWAPRNGRGDACWLTRESSPSLPALVATHAWPALLSLALLVATWAWRAGSRTGPVLAGALPPRRALLEHVRASGQLLWRLGEHDALLAGLRASVGHRLARRHPGWRTLPERLRQQRLAELAGVPGGLLAGALQGAAPGDEAAFVRTVRLLNRAWRSL